jgi:hypothetical protein
LLWLILWTLLEEACDPKRTALVIYDMQVGILRQLQDAAGISRSCVYRSAIRTVYRNRTSSEPVDPKEPPVDDAERQHLLHQRAASEMARRSPVTRASPVLHRGLISS